jgi:DNA-binding winged helix-turn-helix (wHTH) protein
MLELNGQPLSLSEIAAVAIAREPVRAEIELVSPVKRRLAIKEDVLPEDSWSGHREIDILHRLVRAGTSELHLTGLEQSLLYLLASRGGRVVSREDILDAIWGTDYVAESNIVDRHVRSLRTKLQDDYRHPRFIATVSGQGYRFVPTFTNVGWGAVPHEAEVAGGQRGDSAELEPRFADCIDEDLFPTLGGGNQPLDDKSQEITW